MDDDVSAQLHRLTARTKQRSSERAEAMYVLYSDPHHPMSLHDVAIRFGVTRQRVLQVFRTYGYPTREAGESTHLKAVAKKGRE